MKKCRQQKVSDWTVNPQSSRSYKSKTIKVRKLIPVERLHSPLSMMRTGHLKLLSVGDFFKSLLKDITACLLSHFVVTYIKLVPYQKF